MWSHDFCTVCDKQCPIGSMYCSETCREAEHVASMNTTPSPASSGLDSSSSTLFYSTPTSFQSSISGSKKESDDYFSVPRSSIPNAPVLHHALERTVAEAGITKSFLYASPLLAPQSNTSVMKHGQASPPPSPLLMSLLNDDDDDSDFESSTPTASLHCHDASTTLATNEKPRSIPQIASDYDNDHFKSSTNYRRWLTAV